MAKHRTSPHTPTSNLRGAPTQAPAISDAARKLIEQQRAHRVSLSVTVDYSASPLTSNQ